jgi:hypothetical protein
MSRCPYLYVPFILTIILSGTRPNLSHNTSHVFPTTTSSYGIAAVGNRSKAGRDGAILVNSFTRREASQSLWRETPILPPRQTASYVGRQLLGRVFVMDSLSFFK